MQFKRSVQGFASINSKTDKFQKPLAKRFYYDWNEDKGNNAGDIENGNADEQQGLKLTVVPFDVNHQCKDRIDLALLGINNT